MTAQNLTALVAREIEQEETLRYAGYNQDAAVLRSRWNRERTVYLPALLDEYDEIVTTAVSHPLRCAFAALPSAPAWNVNPVFFSPFVREGCERSERIARAMAIEDERARREVD